MAEQALQATQAALAVMVRQGTAKEVKAVMAISSAAAWNAATAR
jgi:hypothetical protein